MLRFICCIILTIALCIPIAYAADETKSDSIPNMTQPQEQPANGNGETVDLGADKDAADFTPTERTVIIRDAIESNRQVANPPNGNSN